MQLEGCQCRQLAHGSRQRLFHTAATKLKLLQTVQLAHHINQALHINCELRRCNSQLPQLPELEHSLQGCGHQRHPVNCQSRQSCRVERGQKGRQVWRRRLLHSGFRLSSEFSSLDQVADALEEAQAGRHQLAVRQLPPIYSPGEGPPRLAAAVGVKHSVPALADLRGCLPRCPAAHVVQVRQGGGPQAIPGHTGCRCGRPSKHCLACSPVLLLTNCCRQDVPQQVVGQVVDGRSCSCLCRLASGSGGQAAALRARRRVLPAC